MEMDELFDLDLGQDSELDPESESASELNKTNEVEVKKKWEEFKDALLSGNCGEMGLFFCVQYVSMFILVAMDIIGGSFSGSIV